MKFKVKSLKHSGDGEEAEEASEEAEGREADDGAALREMLEAADRLVKEKSAVLSRMVNRRAEEKKRLAKMGKAGIDEVPKEMVESEIASLADDVDDLAKLRSELAAVCGKVPAAVASMGMSEEVISRVKAMEPALSGSAAGDGDAEGLAAKEEELARREEMVDRKIKGYASKKKELQDQEASIAAKLKDIEELKAGMDKAVSDQEANGSERVRQREEQIAGRISLLLTVMTGYLGRSATSEDATIDDLMSSFEDAMKALLEKTSSFEEKLGKMQEGADEVKELLKILDRLLGRLPEEAVQEFTQSEGYRLYEKVLERYGI